MRHRDNFDSVRKVFATHKTIHTVLTNSTLTFDLRSILLRYVQRRCSLFSHSCLRFIVLLSLVLALGFWIRFTSPTFQQPTSLKLRCSRHQLSLHQKQNCRNLEQFAYRQTWHCNFISRLWGFCWDTSYSLLVLVGMYVPFPVVQTRNLLSQGNLLLFSWTYFIGHQCLGPQWHVAHGFYAEPESGALNR